MLSPDKKHQSLAGKLLLSSALVAVSLIYGWWGRQAADRPAPAIAPMPLPHVSGKLAAPHPVPTAPQPQTQDAEVAPVQSAPPRQTDAEPQPQKPVAIAKAAPQGITPSAAPALPQTQPQLDSVVSARAASAPVQQPVLQSPPAENASPLEAMITGTPEPGAKAPLPAGTHLADGDYVSGRHELMWGDLRVKIAIRGGQITGMQVLQYPDHRSQSLYLSQMAIPVLESEVIKKQTSQVDTVSSATDTSYVFQDAVADAIVKATRG